MFPFKKKRPAPIVEAPDHCAEVRRKLDETDARLEAALKEMRRRLAERLPLVGAA